MTDLSTHLTKLEGHLARFRDKGILNLIAGQDVAGAAWFETRSPVDESLIAKVALGDAVTVDAAARAAKAAFPAWAALEGAKRKAILHRIADLIEARAEEIALFECWDPGQELGPLGVHRAMGSSVHEPRTDRRRRIDHPRQWRGAPA